MPTVIAAALHGVAYDTLLGVPALVITFRRNDGNLWHHAQVMAPGSAPADVVKALHQLATDIQGQASGMSA